MNRIHIGFFLLLFALHDVLLEDIAWGFFTVQIDLELCLLFCIPNTIQSMKTTKHIGSLYEKKNK